MVDEYNSGFKVKPDGTLIIELEDGSSIAIDDFNDLAQETTLDTRLNSLESKMDKLLDSQDADDNLSVQQAGSPNFTHGDLDVTAAGTAENFPNEPCREATITAKLANTGYIYIGDEVVSDTSFGVYLAAGDSLAIKVANLNQIYIDADNDGEGVRVLYV